MTADKPFTSATTPGSLSELQKLNERSRTIFRQIVESYLATGDPVGSRNLARHLPMTLSPASIRNVMSDLEHLGLIYAPHTSAGRLPTHAVLCMMRREFGSNASRWCMVQRLSHTSTSPTFHTWCHAKRAWVVCAQSSSSSASDRSTESPFT